MSECSRGKCQRRARAKGLCELHYNSAVAQGVYTAGTVESAKARTHVEWLQAEGMSLSEMTRVSGVAWPTLKTIRTGGRILLSTEQRVLKIRPGQRVAAEAKLPVLGTRRRLQALVAIGYTNRDLSERLGLQMVTLWRYTTRSERVEVFAAKAVSDLFDELHMTPGPSQKARNRARKCGWVSSLAWDDIDDPTAEPDSGDSEPVTWLDRYQELKDLGVPESRIPERMGITQNGFDQQMRRLGITKGAA